MKEKINIPPEKEIKKIIREAEKESLQLLKINDEEKIRKMLEENGVKLSTKEEQIEQIKEIVKEYEEEYGSIEELRKRIENEKDNYLLTILMEWEYYEEILKENS